MTFIGIVTLHCPNSYTMREMKSFKREQVHAAELARATLFDWPCGKALESNLITEMLTSLGCSEVKPEASEKPDFFFALEIRGRMLRVGCEMTSLYTDVSDSTTGGGSREARFRERWQLFAKRLNRALLESKDSCLKSVYGAIHFLHPDYEVLDRVDETVMIAEIVNLLKESPCVDRIDSFSSQLYPQLAAHVNHIWTADVVDEPTLWWAAHLRTGMMRDPSPAIIRAVTDKAATAMKYDWRDSEQRWLVITAPGRGIQDKVAHYSGHTYHPPAIQIPFSHVFLFAWGMEGWYVLQVHPQIEIIGDYSALSQR